MKSIKKTAALIMAVCMLAGLLAGCTSTVEGKALYDAMVKEKSVTSSQSDMQFTLRLDATGLSSEDQEEFAQIKTMLDGAKYSMNIKKTGNADNTVAKAQADINVYFGGLSMDMGVWADVDMTGSTPKLKEIVKLPAIMTAMDPSMAGKEYMVLDLDKLLNDPEFKDQAQSMDFSKIMKSSQELQPKLAEFLVKYLAQYDPGFKLVTDAGSKDIATPEGIVKAHIYQVKLDDKAAKQLVRYTVNNLANNKDAMDFAAEYLKFVQQLAESSSGDKESAAELDKAMTDFENQKPAMLEEFNKAMDSIENIKLVGDKGILIEYGIDPNGNIISQSGNMDFVIDVAKLGAVMGEDVEAGSGVYNIGIDFNILNYNINKPVDIVLPTVTSENSINLSDTLKTAEAAKEAEVKEATVPAPKAVPAPAPKVVKPELTVSKKLAKTYDKVNYLPASDTIKLIKGATYGYANGTATIKANGKTLTLVPGKTTKLNGKEIKLKAVNGKIVSGKLYISVEVLEQLGYKVTLK